MPLCRDPLVANLKAQGFNTLRVPRTDYVPGTVLFQSRKGLLEYFGGFSSAFDVAVALPTRTSAQATHFTGISTGRYRRQLGLKIACEWLGVPSGALDATFGKISRVSFHFGEMRLVTTELAAIAAFLDIAEPSLALTALPESRLFIVHEVLQARQISCLNEAEGQAASSFDLDAAKTTASQAGFSVNGEKTSLGLLVFSSDTYHSIGFKAYEIEIAEGAFQLKRALDTAGVPHLTDVDVAWEPVIFDTVLL